MKNDKMTNDFLHAATHEFIDKDSVHVPTSHRFYELAIRLHGYRGADILPLGDDELSNTLMREQVRAYHEHVSKSDVTPKACVLVVITDEAEPRLLLTRRSHQLSSHAGEVSLVGGKRDDTDLSSAQVALREAFEEVGLHQEDAQILGYLPMQISKKGLPVRPVVACIRADVLSTLTPNQDEIARLFWLPFAVLKDKPVDYVFGGEISDAPTHLRQLQTPAWVYDCDDDGTPEVVWGLTGRILASLMEIGFGIRHEWYYRLH